MKQWTKLNMLVAGLLIILGAQAQLPTNRVKPATMYNAGDTVSSPRLGLSAIIPTGWRGVLPRDTEVFLLMPTTNINGEIYVVVNENLDLQGQAARWKSGMELASGLRLELDQPITTRGDDVISGVGKLSGQNANNQFVVNLEAKCSPVGYCLTYMLTTDPRSADEGSKSLRSLVDHTQFGEPSTASPYTNFDWKKFLSGKTLLGIGYEMTSKREDEVHLCPDGTFRSRITRTGAFKNRGKEYQGSKRGTWSVESKEHKATLTLSFQKSAPIQVEMEIKNEDIFVNDTRYFIGDSDSCK